MKTAVANALSPFRGAFGALAACLALAGCANLGGGGTRATATSTAPTPSGKAAKGFSIETPISAIAADPGGRAVLERDLPGLLERPEYGLFKSMSLKALAPLSNGKITAAVLAKVQGDLQGVAPKAVTDR